MGGLVRTYRGLAPEIDATAFVAETAVVIGDVAVGAGSSIWYGCVVRGDVNRIRIGRDSNLQDATVVHVNHDRAGDYRRTGGGMATEIGDGVTVGHRALLHACRLESGCFVGMAAVIMDGAVVETGAMVAAGALVTPGKVVRTGELWAGCPARPMRDLSDAERAAIAYNAGHYARLAAQYLAGAAATP